MHALLLNGNAGAGREVVNLVRDTANYKAGNIAQTTAAHHNHVRVIVGRRFDDHLSGIAP